MTIRLLSTWNGYPAGAVVTLDAATEAALIANYTATSNTAGGIAYSPNQPFQPQQFITGLPEAPLRLNSSLSYKAMQGTMNTDPSNGGAGTGSTANNTYGAKFEVEADFDAVRLIWISHLASTTTGCSAVVASTETAATGTQAALAQPVAGGTAYNSVRSGTASYGWNTVTWSGASSVDLAGSATVATPSVTASDWITCNSIPRADGGTRPLLMWRAYTNGTANAHSFFSNPAFANTVTGTYANRGRVYQNTRYFGGDAVGTLSNSMSLNTETFPIFVQVRHRRRGVSVAAIGDSLTGCSGFVADGISSWLWRACLDASTLDKPVVPCNLGYSSMTSATFWSASKTILATVQPDICFFESFSPNDLSTPTQRSVWDCMGRLADFLDFCAANRITPIVTTPTPMNSYTAAGDAFRVYVSRQVRQMAASRGVIVVDFEGAVSQSGVSPMRWADPYLNDGIHPNESGVDFMASLAKLAIQQAIAVYQ